MAERLIDRLKSQDGKRKGLLGLGILPVERLGILDRSTRMVNGAAKMTTDMVERVTESVLTTAAGNVISDRIAVRLKKLIP